MFGLKIMKLVKNSKENNKETRGRFSCVDIIFISVPKVHLNSSLFTFHSSLKKTALAVFFALCSVVLDFVVILINQIVYKYKLISLVFKAFKDVWQSVRRILGIVMKEDYRAIFNLICYPFANSVGRRTVFPVKRVNIRYKSNILIGACAICINVV